MIAVVPSLQRVGNSGLSEITCCLTLTSVRLAGFRLMEAGLEAQPTIEGSFLRSQSLCPSLPPNHSIIAYAPDSMQNGNYAVRYVIVRWYDTRWTSITCAEAGNNESAACVLACAAKVHYFFHSVPLGSHCCVQYEEALRSVDDPEGQHLHARAQVTIVYFSSRMEAVRLLDSLGVAALIFIVILVRYAHRPGRKITKGWRRSWLTRLLVRMPNMTEFVKRCSFLSCTENDRQLALLSTRDVSVRYFP